MDLTLSHAQASGFDVLDVTGEVDVYTAPRLREAVIEVLEAGGTRLIIDVEKVAFLDSTGLGVLVGALKKVRAVDGTLDIVCTHERIIKIFAITGLDKVFGIFGSIDEVVAQHA